MALDFPASPTVGQLYVGPDGATWKWDGTKWIAVPGSGAGVSSFNTRTGAVTLLSADVITALGYTPYDAANPSAYQTAAQVTAATALFTSAAKGTVPASGGGTTNYLRADGTWAAPPGGSGGITDAPNDGTSYARNSGAWSNILVLPAGSATATSINFGTAGTGIYGGASQVVIATAGTARVTMLNTTLTISANIRTGGGNTAAPVYSFTNDTGLGMYRSAANVLGFTVGGVDSLLLSATAATFSQPVVLPSNASTALQAVPKQQLDAAIAGISTGVPEVTPSGTIYGRGGTPSPAWVAVVPITGAVLTGYLSVPEPPLNAAHAAPKSYVDGLTALFSTTAKGTVPASPGGTTAYLRADGAWSIPAGGGGGGVPEPPTDGAIYGRGGSTPTWVKVLPLTGGSLTGAIGVATTIPSGVASTGWVGASDLMAQFTMGFNIYYNSGYKFWGSGFAHQFAYDGNKVKAQVSNATGSAGGAATMVDVFTIDNTGYLMIAKTPTTGTHAATYSWVTSTFMPVSGGTFTNAFGAITSGTQTNAAMQFGAAGTGIFGTSSAVNVTVGSTQRLGITSTLATFAVPVVLPSDATTALQAVTLQQLTATASVNVGRNYIHNPLMVVAQRGTGPWTATGYTLDRWRAEVVLDTVSISRGTILDGARPIIGDEATYNLTATCTGSSTASAYSMVSQRIEDVRRLANKTVTVSFFAGNAQGVKLGVSIDQNFGSGGSTTVQGVGQSVTLGGGWTRYTLTFVIASASGKTVTAADSYTQLNFWYSSGADNNTRAGGIGPQTFTANQTYFYGVQLEVGSVATLLEKPDPQQDLAKCQRFYETGTFIHTSYHVASGLITVSAPFHVSKRASPTVTISSNTSSNLDALTPGGLVDSAFVNSTVPATGNWFLNATWTASADL